MSGETPSEGGTGQPTTGYGGMSVPLGVHFAELRACDLRFDAERDRRYEDRWKAAEKAVAVAEANAEKWRQNANEWRGTVDDLTKLLPSRSELAAIELQIAELKEARLRDEGGREHKQERRASLQPFQVAILGAIVAAGLAVMVAVALANVLTGSP